jgi:alpha-methylacyl-CoA racemase
MGPLKGLKILEFAGLGPAPFCAMLLSDMGASVIRIDRPGVSYLPVDVEARGRHSLTLNLKEAVGVEAAKSLISEADMLIEGYRPGVMERLGLGPETALELNPSIVYGRMTGWGQTGPLAHKAGHDLNYLAMTGGLHALGVRERPVVPLNLIADFGGGSLYLGMGMLAAHLSVKNGGSGQVVDCAMTEGVLSMLSMIYGDFVDGRWLDSRESNVIDGAAPFYNVYQCADGLWLAVGAIEPAFWHAFLRGLGKTEDPLLKEQWPRKQWAQQREYLAKIISRQTRCYWLSIFDELDACVSPVLSLEEAMGAAQHKARASFVEHQGVVQPAPAPRFSLTPGKIAEGQVLPNLAEALILWQSPV